ncbi:MAG: sulfatase, partial [Planctomycetota bacterium]
DHPVVLVTWDTTRRDVLPLYRGTGLETPSLTAFASRSVVFDHMTSVAPITGPSHATLLTGVIPPTHGLRTHGTTRIADRVPRLAESFRDAGYDTAAFVAARPLLARNGFSKGFRFYDDRLRGERPKALLEIFPKKWNLLKAIVLHFRGPIEDTSLKVPGAEILERVGKYLPTVSGPAFLFVHFFDAHIPYDPPPDLLEKAEREAAGARPPAADPQQGTAFLTLYRAELMELDGYFGGLIGLLEERDPGLKNTVIFMLADHGHCFGEGGYLNTHTPSLYEATQAIPAVLHLPGDRDAGRRVADTVNQVDVAATLCGLAGVAPPAGQQGISLLPAAEGKPLPKRPFFPEGFYMEAWHFDLQDQPRGGGAEGVDDRKQGLRTPEWKYWKWEDGPERLFRLDQGEDEDLSGRYPEVLESMRMAFQKIWDSVPHVREGEASRDMDSGERAALEQLGYLTAKEEEPASTPGGKQTAPDESQTQD